MKKLLTFLLAFGLVAQAYAKPPVSDPKITPGAAAEAASGHMDAGEASETTQPVKDAAAAAKGGTAPAADSTTTSTSTSAPAVDGTGEHDPKVDALKQKVFHAKEVSMELPAQIKQTADQVEHYLKANIDPAKVGSEKKDDLVTSVGQLRGQYDENVDKLRTELADEARAKIFYKEFLGNENLTKGLKKKYGKSEKVQDVVEVQMLRAAAPNFPADFRGPEPKEEIRNAFNDFLRGPGFFGRAWGWATAEERRVKVGIAAGLTVVAASAAAYLAATTSFFSKLRYKWLGGHVSPQVAQKAAMHATEARTKTGASKADAATAVAHVYGQHNVAEIMNHVK